ncbi:UDP-N-acetylmuramate:L-alanyl-gamma-D-glutamyl-meso-diaminopimelate ligase [Idiomarina seosinensis]|uniref:UDP-N-acetylmuramate:L-alanyl-gamma-D-glutamyl- meso-diaminopimelate ligase n=1 Tax=Idiomarina seosinensis TaxID=281739 RepID=UPI0038508729
MRIHIIGICGTFMGGLAAIAKQLGHTVSGSDANVYPPMSTQLQQLGINLHQGYCASHLDGNPDLVIIGNALSRGNAEVERVLSEKLNYLSGAQWLHDHVLRKHWVLAVAGTHGKTTTASMLAWILETAGYNPGFMIGGVPTNFSVSARLTDSDFFVIEADEYDTAFFDKRSKFVHYSPDTLVINNLEFDHADIFPDLAAIQRQFSHLLRVVPNHGQVIVPDGNTAINEVVDCGCWSEVITVGDSGNWQYDKTRNDGSGFSLKSLTDDQSAEVQWSLLGDHNVSNGVMAMLAARHVGIDVATSAAALATFTPPKRRLELLAEVDGIKVYDDFAHHPTAIKTTLAGIKAHHSGRVLAVLEPRSNTMKLGVHETTLSASLSQADLSFVLQPASVQWSVADSLPGTTVARTTEQLISSIVQHCQSGDAVIVMSNGSFDGLQQKLINLLKQEASV